VRGKCPHQKAALAGRGALCYIASMAAKAENLDQHHRMPASEGVTERIVITEATKEDQWPVGIVKIFRRQTLSPLRRVVVEVQRTKERER